MEYRELVERNKGVMRSAEGEANKGREGEAMHRVMRRWLREREKRAGKREIMAVRRVLKLPEELEREIQEYIIR
jgi:hypothetical protein